MASRSFYLHPLTKITISLLVKVPWRVRQKIGFVFGWCIALLPLKEVKVAKLQYGVMCSEDRTGKNHSNALRPLRVVNRIFANSLSTVMESLSIEKILNDKNVSVTCDDWPLVYDLLAKDKGMIAFTGHYGNWELLAGYVALQKNLALSVIGRPARNGDLQKEIARIRQRYGVKTIWRDGSLLAREIIGDLKAGKIIAALIDQDTQVQSVPVPFFGEMAQTPVSLASLALRHDTPVVAAFLRRLSNCQFDVKIYELTERESALKLLIQYNTYLEKEIRKDPSQWVWFHKRWRTTPTGYRRSYKEYIKWLNEKYCSQNS